MPRPLQAPISEEEMRTHTGHAHAEEGSDDGGFRRPRSSLDGGGRRASADGAGRRASADGGGRRPRTASERRAFLAMPTFAQQEAEAEMEEVVQARPAWGALSMPFRMRREQRSTHTRGAPAGLSLAARASIGWIEQDAADLVSNVTCAHLDQSLLWWLQVGGSLP
jgi:hypothetical protein